MPSQPYQRRPTLNVVNHAVLLPIDVPRAPRIHNFALSSSLADPCLKALMVGGHGGGGTFESRLWEPPVVKNRSSD